MQTTIETYVGQRSFETFTRVNEGARNNGHTHWIGDIPVSEELAEFFKAIKTKRYNIAPRVDFSSTPVWRKDPDTSYSIYKKIGITFTGTTEFTCGNIFIDKNSKTGDVEFCVESESIQNDKFSHNSEGYHIRKSKDMAKMLKVALKHLTPLTFNDIQDKCTGALNSGLYTLRLPAQEKWQEMFNVAQQDVLEEVEHMAMMGYVPRTTAFKKVIDLIVTEGAELKRMWEYKPRACFVRVSPTSLTYKFTDDLEPTECTDPTMVPDFIRNKVSVLQIANVSDAIVDVGVRVSDTTYWVFA